MGQPPGPYGAPGPFPPQYGGPYGTPPPPPKRNLLPWLIVGGAVLLSGVGLLLVVLLTRDDEPSRTQAAASTAATPSSPSASRETADLPGGARVVEPTESAGGRFAGSDEVALDWVQAMADGDFQTAYDLSCAEVQASAAAADDGSGPEWALGTYFFEQTLGGNGFTEGSFDDLQYSPVADSDVATFTLQLDSGESFTLLVYVDSTLAVCDFI